MHSRFAPINLDHESNVAGYSGIVEALVEDDKQRTDFLKACLLKLGLQVNQENTAVPSLSRLHLSSMLSNDTSKIMAGLQEIITILNGEEYIKDDNDTFHLEKPSAWSLGSIASALSGVTNEKTQVDDVCADRIIDYDAVVKRLIVHEKEPPASKETPYFNHHAFFANLKGYETQIKEETTKFGKSILYGEVVTSTNTMLEKYDLSYSHPIHKSLYLLTGSGTPKSFDVFPQALLRQLQFKLQVGAVDRMSGCLLPDRSCFRPLSIIQFL